MLNENEDELKKILFGDTAETEIEPPTEDVYQPTLKDVLFGKSETDSIEKTPMQKGKELADKNGAFISSVTNRDTLASFYNAYYDGYQRAVTNNDEVNQYQYQFLMNKVSEQLGKEKNLIQDISSGLFSGIGQFEIGRARDAIGTLTQSKDAIDKFNDLQYVKNVEDFSKKQAIKREASNYGGIAKSAISGSEAIGNMLIPILSGSAVSQATSGIAGLAGLKNAEQIGKYAGVATNLSSMGSSKGGNMMNQALQEGYSFNKAYKYGKATKYSEIASELIGGEMILSAIGGAAVKTPVGSLVQKWVNDSGITNRIVKAGIMGVSNILAESLEEGVTEIVDAASKKNILGDSTDWENLGKSVPESMLGAIIPTLILSGVGYLDIQNYVNMQERALKDVITQNSYLTTEQKGNLIRGIEQASSDARLGLTDNWDYMINSVNDAVTQANQEGAILNATKQMVKQVTGASDEQLDKAMESYAKTRGIAYNNNKSTSQQILDETKPVSATYNNMEQITKELDTAKNEDNTISTLEVVTNINKAQENFKKALEKLTGKQVVYINAKTNDNTTIHGLTSPGGNNLYVTIGQNIKDTVAAGFHELGHHYRELFNGLYEDYSKMYKQAFPQASEYEIEEKFGNKLGSILSKQENVKTLDKQNKTLLNSIKSMVNSFSNKYLGTERNNTDLSAYNFDMSAYLEEGNIDNPAFDKKVVDTILKKSAQNSQKSSQNVKKGLESGSQNVKTADKLQKVDAKTEKNAPKEETKGTDESKKKPVARLEKKKSLREKFIDDVMSYLENKAKSEANLQQGVTLALDKLNNSQFSQLQDEFGVAKDSIDEFYNSIYNDVEERLGSEIKFSRNELNETKKRFSEAKEKVSREDVLKIANSLNIILKEKAKEIIDLDMLKKAGHNQTPKITAIEKWLDNYSANTKDELRKDAIKKAMSLFRDKKVEVKDIESMVEFNKKGIKKTFSGNINEAKLQTAKSMQSIVEEGIYGFTTMDENDPNKILHHHFFAPASYENKNGLIRFIIKEYSKNPKESDKFYYHQFEYFGEDKINRDDALPYPAIKGESKDFEQTSLSETNIPPSNENVNIKQSRTTEDGSFSLPKTDNNGNELSKAVAERNKDSAIINSKGELVIGYHGTSRDFNTFEDLYMGQNQGSSLGDGYYFSTKRDIANTYRQYSKGPSYGRVFSVYLNIKNPFYVSGENKTILSSRTEEILKKYKPKSIETYGIENNPYFDYAEKKLSRPFETIDFIKGLAKDNNLTTRNIFEWLGYDGIVDGSLDGDAEIVAFRPNQIKYTSNETPTDNPDMRYSRTENEVTDYFNNFVKLTPGKKQTYQETVDNFFVRLGRGFIREMLNENEALVKFDNTAAKIMKKKIDNVPSVLRVFDNFRRANNPDLMLQQIARGIRDIQTDEKMSKGLMEIMEDLTPTREEARAMGLSFKEARAKRILDFIDLGLAERATELAKRGIESGIELDKAKSLIDMFKNDKKIHQALEDFRQIGNAILDLGVRQGVWSEELVEQIKKDNILYFPMNRAFDGDTYYGSKGKNGAVNNTIFGIKGSEKNVENPLISAVGNWTRMLQVIETNYMYTQLYEIGEQLGEDNQFFKEVKPLRKFKGQVTLEVFKSALNKQFRNLGYNELVNNLDYDQMYKIFVPEEGSVQDRTLSFLVDGKRKYIQFYDNDYGKPMYEVLSKVGPSNAGRVAEFFRVLNQGITYGATIANTEFAISNIAADAGASFIFNKGITVPIISQLWDAFKLVKGKTGYKFGNLSENETAELYEKFKRSGASQGTRLKNNFESIYNDNLKETFGLGGKQMFGKKGKGERGKFATAFTLIPEFSEEVGRFGNFVRAYKEAKRQGLGEGNAIREAGIKAREWTQDFTIKGKWMKEFNKLVPYSAATLGGLYNFGRQTRMHPIRVASRTTALMAIAALIMSMFSDDDRKYYDEMNKVKKFANYVIPNGTSEPIIIKKPQGPARVLINLAELIYNASNGYIPEDKIHDEFMDWLTMSVEDQLPVFNATDAIPSMLQPIIENMLNVDFYYKSELVSDSLKKLDPENQYNEYTSEVAKALGKVLDYSPIYIDNLIKGEFAGLGKQALDLTDNAVRYLSGNELPEKKKSEKYIYDKFFADSLRSPESVGEVYDRISYLENQKAEGRLTAKEQQEYDKLNSGKSVLSDLSKEIKATRIDDKLTGEQKKEKIENLQELRTDAARYYLGKDLINPKNKTKLSLMEYYPSQDTYVYNVNKNKKVNVDFSSEKIKVEYAKRFKETYEKEIEKLRKTSAYQQSTQAEKYELEKKTKTSARTQTTNDMKEIIYKRTK